MKNANIDLKSLTVQLKKNSKVLAKHAVFIFIIIVLIVYMLVVLKINNLSNAQPSDSAETTALAKNTIPAINKNAVNNINDQLQLSGSTTQSLQPTSNPQRENPFQE